VTLRRRILEEAGAFLFFLALALLFTRPLVLHPRTTMFAGYDTATHTWTLHWLVSHFFEPSRIFEGNLYYPHPHGVLLTEADLGTAVLLLPFRFLSSDPVLLYNAGSVLALAFGAWAFGLLARTLSGSFWAGLGGGVLAAFGSNQVRHLHHLDLITTGWIALFLLGLHRVLEEETPWGVALLSGIAAALTVQSNGYYTVAMAAVGALLLAVSWRRLTRTRVRALLLTVVVASLLSFPYIRDFTAIKSELHLRRGLGWSEHMAFHPASDLGNSGYLEGALLGRGGECLFPGMLTLALAGLALWKRAPQAAFYAAAVVLLVMVSLGPTWTLGGWSVPSPYRLLAVVPPFDSMRHPSTFAEFACFLLGVLASLGFARLPHRAWLGALFVALALAETLAPPHPMTTVGPEPPIFRALESLPPGPALEIPVFSEEIMLCAARSEREFLNGQDSSFFPKDLWQLDEFIEKEWLGGSYEVIDRSNSSFVLDNYPLRYLVLPRGHLRVPGLVALSHAIERSPEFVRVAQTPDGDRIYEVRGWRPTVASLGRP
jgi:hypothetical protein